MYESGGFCGGDWLSALVLALKLTLTFEFEKSSNIVPGKIAVREQ